MPPKHTALIVGGAGYIGSHTTLALNEAGYETIVYDNFSTGHRDACFGTHLVEGDLADQATLTRTFQDHDVDCVIHFAALSEAGKSVHSPLPFFQNNVAGSLALLQAMQAAKVHKLVFSSTAAAYGNAGGEDLLQETHPLTPINPYGVSKVMVEQMLRTCAEAYGFQSIALRYFNACGADPEGRVGERHDPETHLVPLVIDAALGRRPNIKIFGTDYDTPDGSCIRDYIHVVDLAIGHVAAVDKLLSPQASAELGGFTPINLGTGSGLSVRQVIDAVRKVSQRRFEVIEVERRPGDPSCLVSDTRRAKELLGWTAQRSGIEDIVRDSWRFACAQQR